MSAPFNSGRRLATDPARAPPGSAVPFRELIPPPGHPKLVGIDKLDALEWTNRLRKVEQVAWMIKRLETPDKPYIGFTTDGTVKTGVYRYAEDEGAPVEEMVKAAETLIGMMSEEQKNSTIFSSLEDDEMRIWSNPELYINPGGLRLDEISPKLQDAVHDVLKASFSKVGYEKVLDCCRTNHFLGQLIGGPKVLNQHSYNFRLFCEPSTTAAWGYTFFGHHLCLAVVVQGKRMTIGPTFVGAEPDFIDQGPWKGVRLFESEEFVALRLMQGLSPELQDKARLSRGLGREDLPEGRWNPYDERHLGGVRQDNRILPYEGCPVKLFNEEQIQFIIQIYKAFNEFYPEDVLEHRTRNFINHLDETYFAWIGENGDDDPYYYRIHSPCALLELDFHCGIFLTNTSPSRCHIHTINRLPNRGDYGRAMVEGI